MISFIKKYLNIPYLIVFIFSLVLSYFSSIFFQIEVNHFSIRNFLIVLLLNWLPYIVVFCYGFKIRRDLDGTKSIRFFNYILTSLLGSIIIALCILPISGFFMFVMLRIVKTYSNDLQNINFILNIIYLPIFFPIFIFTTGAYSRILGKMEASFKFSEIKLFFKQPFIKPIVSSSLLIYFLPLLLRIASLKLSTIPFAIYFIYNIVVHLAFLLEIFLVMYLIDLWKQEQRSDKINNKIHDGE